VALPLPGRSVEIERTQLGDNAGVVGAACMGAQRAPRGAGALPA
jgi:hypothetical protein